MSDLLPNVATEQHAETMQWSVHKSHRPTALLSPYPGHRLFKLSPNGRLEEVGDNDYELADYNPNGCNNRKLVREKGWIYLSSLNIKNAIRKLRKLGLVK